MKNIGIVCEYNPFHRGHAKQIAFVNGQGASVCLMSGNYVQRGEPAILDKYVRAKAAVLGGANLVLELPLTYAIASAEGFADGAVEIFTRLGCVDALCFGSESGDLEQHRCTAELLRSADFPEYLHRELERGLSFPKARQLALEAMGGKGTVLPNDILAVEYCKALQARGGVIEPLVLKREGDYHGGSDLENPSASFLRTQESWEDYLPKEAWEAVKDAPRYSLAAGERAVLAILRQKEDWESVPYGSEGLWRKVRGAVRRQAGLEDILNEAKSKRYTRSRLMRLLLCAFLGLTTEDLQRPAPYVRVLAADETGRAVLRQMRKTTQIPLIHAGEAPTDAIYGELERRAEDLFGLFCVNQLPQAGQFQRARIFLKNISRKC